MVNPLIIGNGTPIFKVRNERLDLKLASTHRFDSGNVLLTYGPLKASQ